MTKTITFYRTMQYGTEREFVHPSHVVESAIIRNLTGQKTITPVIRDHLTVLSEGTILWQEVVAPKVS